MPIGPFKCEPCSLSPCALHNLYRSGSEGSEEMTYGPHTDHTKDLRKIL